MNNYTKYAIATFFAIAVAIPFKLVAVIGILVVALLITTGIGVCSLRSGIFGPAVTSKKGAESVFLTFDDGPDPELTPKVLDLLKQKGITATFFCIAQKAELYPELVKRIIAEGHGLASHDLTHPWWANFRRYKQLKHDISSSVNVLEQISGGSISLYRPPVGLSNPHTHRVCRELGLTIVGWNRSARDGGNRSAVAISHLAALSMRPGDIVLMHDSAPTMYNRNLFLASLETVISRIKKERFSTESLL